MRRLFSMASGLRNVESIANTSSCVQHHFDSKLNEQASKLFLPVEKLVIGELFQLETGALETMTLDFPTVYVEPPNCSDVFYEKNMEEALQLLYKRHPTLRAYFVRDKNGEPMRVYAEETDKIPFERHNLEFTLHSSEFKRFLQTNIQEIYSQKRLLAKIPSSWHYIQTLDAKALFFYSHHGLIDSQFAEILVNELHHLCRKLHENRRITFEEATKNLAKISSYEEVVRKYWENQSNKRKQECLVNYLKPTFEKLHPEKFGPLLVLPENPEPSQELIFQRSYSDASIQFIHEKNLNTNKILRTLFQLALHKVLQVDSPIIPFSKLNGSRPDYMKGVACCYVMEHVFFQELHSENTLLEQYAVNNTHNKEVMVKFGDLDFEEALKTLSQNLRKDCMPKICYNFVPINPPNSKWVFLPELHDEFSDFPSCYNMFFHSYSDQRQEFYRFVLMYRTSVYDSLTMTRFMLYIMTALDNLERLLHTKICDMTEEKIFNLLLSKNEMKSGSNSPWVSSQKKFGH